MAGKAVALAGVLGRGTRAWGMVGGGGHEGLLKICMIISFIMHDQPPPSRRYRAGHSAGSLPNM